MALWLIRSGSLGEREALNLEKGVAAIGWEKVGDLLQFHNREEILHALSRAYPEQAERTIRTWSSELWAFSRKIQLNDFVAMPLRGRGSFYLGRVIGSYGFEINFPENSRNTIKVHWLDEYPRTSFPPDILRSLRSIKTVAKVNRDHVDERMEAIISGVTVSLGNEAEEEIEAEEKENLEQYAQDQITGFINKNYKEHDLERLVAALLEAQGYAVRQSPPGPDGGVDILAGSGPLGFDQPRLAVQVKSGITQVDVDVYRAFSGVMDTFKADHGLIVSWSGYRGTVLDEAAKNYFKIRLWDAQDLVRNVQSYYDKLPEDIQAELPLKQIWILLPEEEE